MSSVFDVAEYILNRLGSMSAMKLQKLVYYSQAWHLVWDEEPLFAERIEAWANGPVVPSLYYEHRGHFRVEPGYFQNGNPKNFTETQVESIEGVLSFYGEKDPQWLSNLTHIEEPWKNARADLEPGERGQEEITHESMAEYYGGL